MPGGGHELAKQRSNLLVGQNEALRAFSLRSEDGRRKNLRSEVRSVVSPCDRRSRGRFVWQAQVAAASQRYELGSTQCLRDA